MNADIIKNENGFTLVEVLFTILLVSILSASVLSLFSQGMVRSTKQAKEMNAIYFAQDGIEQLIADRYTKGFKALKNSTCTFHDIKRTVVVDSLSAHLKKITVLVEWDDRTDSLVSMIGRYE